MKNEMPNKELIARLRDCSSDEAMWSRQAADRIEALVKERDAAEQRGYANADWPEDQRAQYPSYQRKWERDMDLCNRIDAALLSEIEGEKK